MNVSRATNKSGLPLAEYVRLCGGIAEAVRRLHKVGVWVSWWTLHRWARGKSKPSHAYRELLARVGILI